MVDYSMKSLLRKKFLHIFMDYANEFRMMLGNDITNGYARTRYE